MSGINLDKIKKIRSKDVLHGLGLFWRKTYRLVLFLAWAGILGWGGYVWYVNLYNPQWLRPVNENASEKNSEEVNLNKKTLEKVMREIDAREKKFGQESPVEINPFKKY